MRWIEKTRIAGLALALIWLSANAASWAQNFWQQTGGPVGGEIKAFAVKSTGEIFAATRSGGVFRSTDNGENWMTVNNGLTNTDLNALAVNSSGHIFAGTPSGVFRSMDNGSNWALGLTTGVSSFAINNSNSNIFGGSNGGGVFRSTNNGNSWMAVNTGLSNKNVQSLAINSSGHIFAGTVDGIFRSLDNGNNWMPANAGLSNTNVQSLAINSNGHIFAGTAGGIFRSLDNGNNWAAINTGLTNTDVRSLAINSSGHIFAGTGGGVFYSRDNGSSWTLSVIGDVKALAVSNSNGDIFAGTIGGGAFRSKNNGDSWAQINSGLANTFSQSLAVNPVTQDIFAGTPRGVFRSMNNGDSWNNVSSVSMNMDIIALAINPSGHIFAGTGGGVFRSTDNGGSWSAGAGLPNTRIWSLAINNSTGDILAGTGGGGVFRSTDNGSNWVQINAGLTTSIVFALAINSSGHIFIGTAGGRVFRSTNNGDTWTSVNSSAMNTDIRTLAINSVTQDIFAGTDGGGVFQSTDNGNSWAQINTGLTNTKVRTLVFDLARRNIFAGTFGGGVFRSMDNGGSWMVVNAGLTNTFVVSTAINSSGFIFAGTNGNGVFRSVQSTITEQFTRMTAGEIVNDGGKSFGCSWSDYDNDGNLDLFVTNYFGKTNNFLYRNKGDGTFAKITASDVVSENAGYRGCSWGDYDNDSDLDLFVAHLDGKNFLYKNGGNGILSKVPTGVIGNDGGGSMSGSWGDYDNDGNLDLFVANSGGQHNFLYKNLGNDTFMKDTTATIVRDGGNLQGCSWGDYDNDGDLDLFVANDGNNFLYRNNRYRNNRPDSSGFTKITNGAIVTDGGSSIGGSWGDYDNDGDLDLFVTNTGSNPSKNFLYQNDGNGNFTKIITGEIVNDPGFYHGSSWGDFDNDGDLDLFVANSGGENDFLYQNNGNGTFTRIVQGDLVNNGGYSIGCSWGDYDNDGDLDLFVANYGTTSAVDENNFLYKNNGNSNNWIKIRLIGTVSNKSAIGAKVRVKATIKGPAQSGIWQMREISGQTGAFSQNSLNAEFGLGEATVIDSIKVEWPSRTVQVLTNVAVDKFLTIAENAAPTVATNPATSISISSATLNATVIPNGLSTTVKFEYGTTTAYGNEIAATPSPVSGTNAVLVSAAISSLSPNTLYHYRVVGSNSAGTTNGADQTFTTSSTNQAPLAPTLALPTANAFINDNTPALAFNVPVDANGDQLHFRVEIDDDGNFGAGTQTFESRNNAAGFNPTPPVASGSGQVTYTVQSALADGDWWWRVSAWDGEVYGNASAARRFVIDVAKPFTSNHNPAKGATGVPLNSNIVVHVQDVTSGVNRSSIVMKVNGNNVSPAITGAASNYILTYDPPADFGFQQTVTVSIDAADSAGNAMATDAYSFITAGQGNSAPAAPTLASPLANAFTNDNTPALAFNVPSDPNGDLLHFKVEIDDDGSFGAGTQTFESRNNTTGFNPTPPVAPGSGQVTYTVQSALADGDWWWRVSAWDGQVYGNLSAARKFVIDQTPPVVAPLPGSSPASGQNHFVIATAMDIFGIQTAAVFHRQGGATDYLSVPMINIGGNTYRGTIPGASVNERGVEYYIAASDSAGNVDTFPKPNPQAKPEVIQVTNGNLAFPGATPAKAYRMISVPFDLDNKSASSVFNNEFPGAYDQIHWRLLRYVDPRTNIEFGESGFPVFAPGTGFWLIAKDAKKLDAGAGRSVSTEQNYTITLPPGWSQIGNPFAFTVNWSDVTKKGTVEGLVGYEGVMNEQEGYRYNQTQLMPFAGYFVNNKESSQITIEIPPKAATGSVAAKPVADWKSALQNNEWALQVTAESGRYLDKDNYLGSLTDANNEWDANDFSEAPFFDQHVALYFPHPEWKKYPDLYTGDFREIKAEGDYWDFVVKFEVAKSEVARSEVVLKLAEVQNLPADWEVVLLDKASRVTIDFSDKKQYTFPSGNGKTMREFRVVVGKKDFVETNDLNLSGVPQAFALGQNYPNPFYAASGGQQQATGNPQPGTRIGYELPVASYVKIAVYNLSGQFVRTLFGGEQSAGRYVVSWDGTNFNGERVASGVYLARMEAAPSIGSGSTGPGQRFAQTRKIVLTR
jgi:photosystem II stability/assembly factor-like uncharacterized protein